MMNVIAKTLSATGRRHGQQLLVLIATYNGGGSGTFYTLHILDVSGQRAFDMDGDIYQRINVTSVRNVALGDRWDGNVKICFKSGLKSGG